jgi:hypothetical protein
MLLAAQKKMYFVLGCFFLLRNFLGQSCLVGLLDDNLILLHLNMLLPPISYRMKRSAPEDSTSLLGFTICT